MKTPSLLIMTGDNAPAPQPPARGSTLQKLEARRAHAAKTIGGKPVRDLSVRDVLILASTFSAKRAGASVTRAAAQAPGQADAIINELIPGKGGTRLADLDFAGLTAIVGAFAANDARVIAGFVTSLLETLLSEKECNK